MRNLVFALALILSLGKVSAQEHQPTTTWPYVYSDFREGELKKIGGSSIEGLFNIHLAESRLHFIEDGMIKETATHEIFSLKVGSDIYTAAGGAVMKVLAKTDKGMVVEEAKADFAALNATGGAYGSSSNSISTQALSSLEGIGGTRTNMNHMELKNSKDSGEVLPVVTKIYLVLPGKIVYAARKDVSEIDGIDKKALSAFIKENKIRWKDPQSLALLLDYIAEFVK